MRKLNYIILVSVLLSGCTLDLSRVDQGQGPTVHNPIEYATWTGDDHLQFQQQLIMVNGHEELFNIAKVGSAAMIDIEVDEVDPLSVHTWQEQTNALLAINGSYFDENDELVTRTVTTSGSYGPLLSRSTGLFALEGDQWIVTTWSGNEPSYSHYIQSYPMLITDGKISFTAGSDDTAQRTIVATDAEGTVYMITAEYGVLTLAELATALLKLEGLKLTQALNLDGGTSTGMAISTDDVSFVENSLAVPSAILVF